MLFASSLSFLGCSEVQERSVENVKKMRETPPDYNIVIIDGCEYLRLEHTHGYASLTHKGNCKNPIHCYNETTHIQSSLH